MVFTAGGGAEFEVTPLPPRKKLGTRTPEPENCARMVPRMGFTAV